MLLSETWLKPVQNFRFSGFKLYRKDRPDGYGGVAILIKNHIRHKLIILNSSNFDFECIGIEVEVNQTLTVSFLSIYAPPGTIINYQCWNALMGQLSGDVFIGGDFNAHSPSWGCSFEDRSGKYIIENIDPNGLYILNNGSNTRLPHPRYSK